MVKTSKSRTRYEATCFCKIYKIIIIEIFVIVTKKDPDKQQHSAHSDHALSGGGFGWWGLGGGQGRVSCFLLYIFLQWFG